MSLRKGENTGLPTAAVRVEFGRRAEPGAPRAHVCALLLSETGALRDAGDLVHPGAPVHASGAVRHEGSAVRAEFTVDTLTVDLAALGPGTHAVLVVARGDGGSFGSVPELWVRVGAPGAEPAQFDCTGATTETAYVLGECYRRAGGWRFRAVGQGYDGGFAELAGTYGLSQVPPFEATASPGTGTGTAGPQPGGAPVAPVEPVLPAAPVSLSKVTLTKSAPAVSLATQGATSGALRVGLNWQAPSGHWRGGIDLDLCALFELTDGSKGVVQALGGALGSLHQPPFILLDGDDRTGAAAGGENLTVNLDHLAYFRRILVFVTIYEGADSFAGLHASVTLRPQHGAPVDFALDECTVDSKVCALALITREGSDLVVRREARYLLPRTGVSPQRTVDYAYGWGLNWTPGRK
ncbi:TerD domain-containing protein [Streptomyces sp. NBC_01476]|uniref:TerD family protein n=1 Tax=Streptomyces sp. NBC_01476 TaxID=2903881 RepID=UPI002E363BF1|nr:TerD family protein [Streptomyces sp. NBC_01476]